MGSEETGIVTVGTVFILDYRTRRWDWHWHWHTRQSTRDDAVGIMACRGGGLTADRRLHGRGRTVRGYLNSAVRQRGASPGKARGSGEEHPEQAVAAMGRGGRGSAEESVAGCAAGSTTGHPSPPGLSEMGDGLAGARELVAKKFGMSSASVDQSDSRINLTPSFKRISAVLMY